MDIGDIKILTAPVKAAVVLFVVAEDMLEFIMEI